MNEIDALTTDVLPLLVPRLNVDSMRIKEGDWTPPRTFSKSKGKRLVKKLNEFGKDFSSPEVHSTPARRHPHEPKGKKMSAHKRHHFSLPRYVFQTRARKFWTNFACFSLGIVFVLWLHGERRSEVL